METTHIQPPSNEAKERAGAAWKMSEENVEAAQVAAAERRARREARASSRRSVAQRRPEPVVGVVLDEIESHPTKEAEESGPCISGSISGKKGADAHHYFDPRLAIPFRTPRSGGFRSRPEFICYINGFGRGSRQPR